MPALLIHHAASRNDHSFPPNSLQALAHCLAANARVIEVDISPLRDADFILAHDNDLSDFSSGSGPVAAHTAETVSSARLLWQGLPTPHAPGLLSEVLDLLARHPAPVELQLDLKEYTPLGPATLERLAAQLAPLREKVRVTSCADWALRRLHSIDPALPLGFDPLFYLDVSDPSQRDPDELPMRMGPFGYWDEHPLAAMPWTTPAAYLAERFETLWHLAPRAATVWYLHHKLVLHSLDQGFDWIDRLHQRGVTVVAWTLDAPKPGHVEAARRLAAAGVDRITTNDPPSLQVALIDQTTW